MLFFYGHHNFGQSTENINNEIYKARKQTHYRVYFFLLLMLLSLSLSPWSTEQPFSMARLQCFAQWLLLFSWDTVKWISNLFLFCMLVFFLLLHRGPLLNSIDYYYVRWVLDASQSINTWWLFGEVFSIPKMALSTSLIQQQRHI